MDTVTIEEIKDRKWIPFTLTGVWFVIGLCLVIWKRGTLEALGLNEIGDALAGFFSPVAFLWLVSGYLQQGRELKVSSDALLLQAKELNNSVLQQQELVKVGKEELAIARSEQHNARDREKDSIRPIFRVSSQPPKDNGYNSTVHSFNVRNGGEAVKKVSAKILGNIEVESTMDNLRKDTDSLSLTLLVPNGAEHNEFILQLDYELLNGESEQQVSNASKIFSTYHFSTFTRKKIPHTVSDTPPLPS